ncbi:MAG: tRNA dihydrouridine synthase DusB [Lachnospiraceae bacterium]|nr:tRNA dihydrouridine synthase DusB [Lachnoclostridium sp.]MDY2598907.1 tRNA dihydrouridine synthase DusB [Lachnospiraceae bacterium]
MKDVKENRVNNLVIGNVKLDGNLILAPMAGVTDLPFRMLCKEQGASLVYTEMISAKGIYYNNKNTGKLWETDASERPVSLQLFGSDPDLMADMAAKIEDKDFDIYDINMGCPVPKVVNNGEGSALMNNPKLAGEIIEKMTKAVKKPVTVKFRKGFGKDDNTAVEFAKVAEAAGAAAIAVHGRTREQYYQGKADWDVIRDVKNAVSIPVIGNGDLFTPEDVKNMYEHTGVDGFMFGRGVRGNPWLFKRTRVYLETGEIPVPPNPEEIMDMMIRHGKMNISFKGEFTGMREMRKHAAWYTKGMKNSAQFREKCSYIETLDDLVALRELIV